MAGAIPSVTGGASAAQSKNTSGGSVFGNVDFSSNSDTKWILIAAVAAVAIFMFKK
jgi:hypothetical protein